MSVLDLPVVDLTDFGSDQPGPFLATLSDALQQWGFVAIRNHGIPTPLLDRAYQVAEDFFGRPSEYKRNWEFPGIGRQRGYTGFGVEHARDQRVHDLKEFWQVGRTLPTDHPLVVTGMMPNNIFPDLPDFAETFSELFDAMESCANRMLQAISACLDLPPEHLLDAVEDGNSVMRVIHYPPLRRSDPADAVRAAAHEDINLLTILPASTAPGLQLQDRSGDWLSVQTPADVVICDTGDIMARLTGGLLPAVTHRVVNPPGSANGSRYSMPFFVHPRPEWVIRPIQGEAEPITAGELLRQRLIEIGVL